MDALYRIANEYQIIFDKIDDLDHITESEDKLLDDIKGSYEQKAIAIASFIKNMTAEKELVNNAINDMVKRKRRIERKLEWVTEYLRSNMERCNITEISSSPYFKIKLKNCPISINVIDENIVPSEYKNVKETISIDKIKAKRDMLDGIYIEGLIFEHNTRLEIK